MPQFACLLYSPRKNLCFFKNYYYFVHCNAKFREKMKIIIILVYSEINFIDFVAGDNCTIDIDECETNPCQNEGVCTDLINNFHCECQLGFTGTQCEINIDECEPEPCQHGGLCIDGMYIYTK